MNGAQLHLLSNHLPVIALPFALLVSLIGLWRRQDEVLKVGLLLLALAGAAALPAFFSGEPAEEVVERIPGVADAAIHEHEDAARFGLALALLTATFAVAALTLGRGGSRNRLLVVLTVVIGLVATASLARVAHLGGLIRHSEIAGGQ